MKRPPLIKITAGTVRLEQEDGAIEYDGSAVYFSKNGLRVDVSLEGKALELVLEEQAKLVKNKTPKGKQKVINMLLTELYQRRDKEKQ